MGTKPPTEPSEKLLSSARILAGIVPEIAESAELARFQAQLVHFRQHPLPGQHDPPPGHLAHPPRDGGTRETVDYATGGRFQRSLLAVASASARRALVARAAVFCAISSIPLSPKWSTARVGRQRH